MEEVEDNEISKFVGECRKYPFYQSIDLKTVEIRVDEDRWVNLATRVLLSEKDEYFPARKRIDDIPDYVEIEQKELMSLDRFKELLRNIDAGKLDFDSLNIGIEFEKTPNRFTELERELSKERYRVDWKTKVLAYDRFEYPRSWWDRIHEINPKLNRHGYKDINGATTHFIGHSVADDKYKYTQIEIIAPIYVRLESLGWDNVEVKCHKSVKPSDIGLSLGLGEGNVVKEAIPEEKFRRSEIVDNYEDKWFYKLKKSVKTKDATSVQFYLFLNDELVDKAYKSKEVTTVKPEKVGSSEQTSPAQPTINIYGGQVAFGKGIIQTQIKQIIDAIQKSSEVSDEKKEELEELSNKGQEILKTEGNSFYIKVKNWALRVIGAVKDNKEITLLVMQLIILLT